VTASDIDRISQFMRGHQVGLGDMEVCMNVIGSYGFLKTYHSGIIRMPQSVNLPISVLC
jgi:hypothetical protein